MIRVGRPAILAFFCLGLSSFSLAQADVRLAAMAIEGGRIVIPPPDADGVSSIKGLPYAAPPVGALRWRPPAPVVPWNGLRQTSRFAAECMQEGPGVAGLARSEDCLYLNIWTTASPGTHHPVFVWIHGGGSRVGSGAEPQFDGAALAKKGVVVVTINYRLGVFGFLSTRALSAESGYGASGDYGFMDEMAALSWVQRNITAFGGDPRRVTVGGESSGSVSTSVLMASPMAAGLFQQAIGESGSAFRVAEPGSMGATSLSAEQAKGETLMAIVGATDLAQLRALPAETLLSGVKKTGVFFNLPVVDGHVLPASPWRRFEAGKQNDVPLLVGWNADEGSMQLMGPLGDLPQLLKGYYGPAAGEIAPFYSNAESASVSAAIKAAGDHGIGYPTWKWALAQLRFGKQPVYMYAFDRAPPIPRGMFAGRMSAERAGAFHGAEIVYVFNTLASQPTWAFTEDDRRIAEQMSSYWANFIKTGQPNGPGLPQWPAYDPAHGPQRMRIGLETGAVPDPDYRKFLAIKAAHDRVDPPDPAQPWGVRARP